MAGDATQLYRGFTFEPTTGWLGVSDHLGARLGVSGRISAACSA